MVTQLDRRIVRIIFIEIALNCGFRNKKLVRIAGTPYRQERSKKKLCNIKITT